MRYAPAMTVADRLSPSAEVRSALAAGRPMVALESTLISHGLPYPQNIAVARASEAAVRESGAVPATVAIRDGHLLIGLDGPDLEALATAPPGSVLKAARPSLAVALGRPGWAATTVSATMIAAAAAGIRVFATGGIGGVHRGALGGVGGVHRGALGGVGGPGDAGASPTLDISSDLEELARSPVAVVCAGPKAILDLPLTLEYLETRGVPVPTDAAMTLEAARSAIDAAIAEADANGVRGPALTPWLLARIAELTGGASLRANTALIENDARVAGRLAVALAKAAG